MRHKVFVSYHHANDQFYKNELLKLNEKYKIFIDASVDTGDIDDKLLPDAIRQKIRDNYLKDSTITILLVGTETKNRKHIDWELYSSMYNGKINKQSGIIVINLPSTNCTYHTAAHGEKEKNTIHPTTTFWTTIKTRTEYESRYPYLPSRIIDNLLNEDAKISVLNWTDISSNLDKLKLLIDLTFDDRSSCKYDLTLPMKQRNS